MAKLNVAVESENVGKLNAFQTIPAGQYLFQIMHEEEKTDNDSIRVTLHAEVQDGEFQGAKVITTVTIKGSEKAVHYGTRIVKAIGDAVGVPVVEDTQQLHFIPFLGDVEVTNERTDPKTGKVYPPRNEIVQYHRVTGATTTTKSAAPAVNANSTPAAAASTAAPARREAPWKR